MSGVFESIFSSIEAIVYRCRNDENYTMEFMEGGVQALTGYTTDDMIGNARVSWVGITEPEDVDPVFAEVDAAIAANTPWDVAYRVVHRSGSRVWVRERGCAVYEDGRLAHLQGLIVGAAAEMELRGELEELVTETSAANSEIVALSGRITASVRQLSLLSINARIEAARSGPAGAGFAVVANEIKSLAVENGKWAQIITEKLSQSSRADISGP